MQCTLYIPYLIPPREPGGGVSDAVHAPHLRTLLARAQHGHSQGMDESTLLCDAFGIARQQDYPLAPVLARSAGLPAEQGYWLCATPVHLETRRNALILAGPAALDISAAESAALASTLAAHLRDENVTLHAPRPDQWFIRSDLPCVMTTTGLDRVVGRDVRECLPQGADSRRWHRLLTEMQMLLHAHPVNEAREAGGRTPVNSVWLWAGGTLPAQGAAPYAAVWSNDAVICALAHHTGSRVDAAPARITPEALDEGSYFFSTLLLAAPMRQGDLKAWSAAVTAIDHDWFQPLLNALKTRRLSLLRVLSHDHSATHEFVIHPHDLFKFWRKNKYL
jgi:hypothetical protein